MATSSKAKKTVRIASGRKRARQDVKLNAANTALRSKFRTVIKNVQKAVLAGEVSDGRFELKGDLWEFPFRDASKGRFLVEAAIDGSFWRCRNGSPPGQSVPATMLTLRPGI